MIFSEEEKIGPADRLTDRNVAQVIMGSYYLY